MIINFKRLIPCEVEGSFWVLVPAHWGGIKRKSFVDTSSACGEVVHFLLKER